MILNKACFSVVEFFLYLCKITLKFFIAFEVFCYRLCSDTEIFYLDINFKKFNFFEHKCQKIYYYKIKLQQIWILNKQFYNKIRINKRIFFINLALKFSRCCETNLTFFLIYFYEKLNVRIKFLFFSQRHEKKIFLLFRRNYLAHSRSYFFKKFTLLRMCYSFDNFKNSSYNFLKLNLKNYINNLNTYIYTKNIFFSIKIIKCYYVKHRYNLYKFSRFFESYFKNTDLVKKIQQRFRIHFYLLKLFFFHFLCQDIFFLNQIFYFFGDLRTISTTKKYIFCSRKNDWLFYHNKHRTRNMHFQIFSENIDCDVNIKTKRYYFPLEILCRNFPSFFLKLFKKKNYH
ncbi:hypothetical protein CPARA_1gp156 (nucleomorph) [Cryptomonas paramecium]|uniref:Uncharacterized protein n=1 Tax=Cryptomonas paramaecium TaxID=2898 RepID=F2HHL8_9CRYP|nr:hypothetical protein CPARA_1gp156 [Cryptomonas paramecium]AEA38814.1 hypothetical protein CPARA_1gp156 [Cryptomonas paramecium]